MSRGIRDGIILLLFFIVCMLAGYNVEIGYLRDVLRQFQETTQNAGFDPISMAIFVFLRNSFVAAITIISGLLVFPPILILANNGLFIGYVVKYAIAEEGSDPVVIGALIAPHGVLEIPVLILSTYLGLRVAAGIVDKVRGKRVSIGSVLKEQLEKLKVIILLLAVSAVVEALLTPLIAILYAHMLGVKIQ